MFIELALTGLAILILLLSCVADKKLNFLSPLQTKTAHILYPQFLLIAHAITNNLVDYRTVASFNKMI